MYVILGITFLAAPSEDYTSFSEEVLISGRSPGSLTCVNITIVDDSVAETLESFTVALSQPSTGVTISSSGVKSRVDIIDTDKTAGRLRNHCMHLIRRQLHQQ